MAKNSCEFCGNNPVPHYLTWYFESTNVLLAPIRSFLLYNPIIQQANKIIGRFGIGLKIIGMLSATGVVTFRTERQHNHSPRAQVLWEEAQRRGITMKEVLLFGKGTDSYIAEKSQPGLQDREGNKLRILFSGLPRPAGYNKAILDSMDDKWQFKKVLVRNNLPHAQGGVATRFWQAKRIFRKIQEHRAPFTFNPLPGEGLRIKDEGSEITPVIVKPRTGSRGRHSITYIYTKKDLKKAFRIAKQLCYWVVVEEHLNGPVYRATCINFKTRGVLRGDSPSVVGDGLHTISELVEQKNNNPHAGVKDIRLDRHAQIYLGRQGLNFSSVLEQGKEVTLTEKIGVNYGGSSSEDISICHPENIALFDRAARALGDPIVGFDFIIQDITVSWKEQKCGFIEANSLPFINLHHDPLLGKPENVAQYVWELIGM